MQKEFVRLHHNQLQWQHNGIDRHMNHVIEFREKMLVLMHFIGSQLARVSEILSGRYCNITRDEHRNIFVKDRIIVFVTRGHKGYSLKEDVKVIHRYLTQEVATLLVYYLLLVLSFQQRLELVIWNKAKVSPFLWSTDSQEREFTSERMRQCIKRDTQAGMGVELTIQIYREISIAMSRR